MHFSHYLRVKAMLQHLQDERVRLLSEVATLESSNEALKAQLAKAKEKAQQRDQVLYTCACFLLVRVAGLGPALSLQL